MRGYIGNVNGANVKLLMAVVSSPGANKPFNFLKLFCELSYLLLKLNDGFIYPHFTGKSLRTKVAWVRN